MPVPATQIQSAEPGFLWGAATAAYQVEGAANQDGRGPSIWDVFSHTPGKTADGHHGDTACDHYHRFLDDVALMRELNLGAYRFSISWPRVLPQGRGDANSRGLDFYDRLVDGLHAAGIEPLVTLYHWDLPAALQMELGGWLHPDLPKIFADYAAFVFDRLGDRVRFWLTLNEPWCCVDGGYFTGLHAPGARNRPWGYLAGHNLLRAHALAVAAYRVSGANGAISLALNVHHSEPASERLEDRQAAERAMIGFGGWFGDPAFRGDYPQEMRDRLGELLPEFSSADAMLLRGSMDYLALNYYLSDMIRDAPGTPPMDTQTVPQPDRLHTAMGWPVVPAGLRSILGWLARRYPGLPIYITENGACFDDVPDDSGFVNDVQRVAYLREHIAAMGDAMADGVDVRGYFAWSLMDNFEWTCGYHKRFGLVRCDFETQRRTIKASGRWYANYIADGGRAAGESPSAARPVEVPA